LWARRIPDQISVTREEGEGKGSEEGVATAAISGSGTLGRRRTGLAPATGSTPAPKSRRERCMRRRSGVHYWSAGKSQRKFRLRSGEDGHRQKPEAGGRQRSAQKSMQSYARPTVSSDNEDFTFRHSHTGLQLTGRPRGKKPLKSRRTNWAGILPISDRAGTRPAV